MTRSLVFVPISLLFFLSSLPSPVSSRNDDRFHYGTDTIFDSNGKRDFGLFDWDRVTCDDLDVCLGFPDNWDKVALGWRLPTSSNCRWCPEGDDRCDRHSMSPIRLKRDRGDPSSANYKECVDAHWMKYEEGGCTWEDMVDNSESQERSQFHIRRHALQILQPTDRNGNIRCPSTGDHRFPRIDYPKGFPEWWHLAHTEISVRSEHFQETKQYDAEVHLSHFYSEAFETREVRGIVREVCCSCAFDITLTCMDTHRNSSLQLGKVGIFLQAYEWAEKWDFLDKLICQFREEEEKVREECGLPSVDPYPGCRNPSRLRPPTTPFPTTASPVATAAPVTSAPTTAAPAPETPPPAPLGGSSTPAPTTPQPMAPPTPAPVPRTPAPVPRTPAPVPRTPAPVPRTPAPVPLTREPTPPPVLLDCPAYEPLNSTLINYNRICKDGGCCDAERSSTDHCHFVYGVFGERVSDMCQQCCPTPKIVGPPPPVHPTYPQMDCRTVQQPQRICRGCCEAELALDDNYCRDVYTTYPFEIKSICWYCCGSTPKEVGVKHPGTRRNLRRAAAVDTADFMELMEQIVSDVVDVAEVSDEPTIESALNDNDMASDESSKSTDMDDKDPARTQWIKGIKLSEADLKRNESFTDEEFTRMVQEYEKQEILRETSRNSTTAVEEERRRLMGTNFDWVPYRAYEWMLRVRTEVSHGV
jgi:hypothetical protein